MNRIDQMSPVPDPEQVDTGVKFLFAVGQHLKEWSIPIAIGLAVLFWKLVKFLGLDWINAVKELKEDSKRYATNEDIEQCDKNLAECHRIVGAQMERHFDLLREDMSTIRTDIKDVHARVDDVNKTILIRRVKHHEEKDDTND